MEMEQCVNLLLPVAAGLVEGIQTVSESPPRLGQLVHHCFD